MWLASVYYCYIYSRYSPIYVYICYNVSNFDSLSNQIHKTSIAFSDPGNSLVLGNAGNIQSQQACYNAIQISPILFVDSSWCGRYIFTTYKLDRIGSSGFDHHKIVNHTKLIYYSANFKKLTFSKINRIIQTKFSFTFRYSQQQ